MAVINWAETTAEAIFGDNQFYKWLTTVFASKNHTHSGYASSSHTHSISDVTSLQTSLDAKEVSSNKTSSWNSTTNNTRYPTEKLVKDTLDTKENTSNKTSSWNSTTNNTRYPTEKLVKDSLDTKEDSSNKTSSWNTTPNDTRYPTEKLVKDSISLSSYTLTSSDITSSNFSTCDVTFYKQLNMVTCIYHIVTTTYADKNDHTVTSSGVPSGYRPSDTFYQDVCTYNGDKRDGLISVNNTGAMKIRVGTANTSMNIYGSFTYIV